MKQIEQIEKSYLRDDLPDFRAGDSVRVHVKIKEGEKERIQVFQGTCIARRGGGTGATFTVRKVSQGIGVERVFPTHSPNLAKVEKVRSGAVRRAKLNYLRNLTGKSARIRELRADNNKAANGEETASEPNTQRTDKEAESPTE